MLQGSNFLLRSLLVLPLVFTSKCSSALELNSYSLLYPRSVFKFLLILTIYFIHIKWLPVKSLIYMDLLKKATRNDLLFFKICLDISFLRKVHSLRDASFYQCVWSGAIILFSGTSKNIKGQESGDMRKDTSF